MNYLSELISLYFPSIEILQDARIDGSVICWYGGKQATITNADLYNKNTDGIIGQLQGLTGQSAAVVEPPAS
jgi:hypothetical protein